MADRVHRVTMFKIASQEERDKLLAQYKVLGQTHEKVGNSSVCPLVFSFVLQLLVVIPRRLHVHH
jgi:hypothetical protein